MSEMFTNTPYLMDIRSGEMEESKFENFDNWMAFVNLNSRSNNNVENNSNALNPASRSRNRRQSPNEDDRHLLTADFFQFPVRNPYFGEESRDDSRLYGFYTRRRRADLAASNVWGALVCSECIVENVNLVR